MSKLEKHLNDIIKVVEKFGLKWKWSTYKGVKCITIYESDGVNKMKYTIDDVMKELLFMKKDIGTLKTDVSTLKTDVSTLKNDVRKTNKRIDYLVDVNKLQDIK